MMTGMVEVLGALSVGIGVFVIVVGFVYFVVQAFRTSLLWGLGVLFVPFVPLIFLIAEWDVAKRPFFWKLYGLAILMVGVVLLSVHGGH